MDMQTSADLSTLRINGERLWQSLMELAAIGATRQRRRQRLALTDLDKQGRDLVVAWGREAGMSVTIDQIGNTFMRRAGSNNALPPIVTGSHIDTQPTGGKFDGNYGVLSALEVVRTLNDHDIRTAAPIEVAFWTNEEGSRFVPVMMGSGVFCQAPSRWSTRMRPPMSTARRLARNWRGLAISATRCRASIRSAPISRRTSNRARYSKMPIR